MRGRKVPDFVELMKHYPVVRSPCDEGWDNQCAVRCSIALIGSGFPLVGYADPLCRHGHARGAESLANYLWKEVGRPTRHASAHAAKTKIFSKKGIVLFKDISGFRSGRGDHIDLWDGQATTTGEYFSLSREVWFWEAR